MKQAHEVRLVPTRTQLTVTIRVAGGGAHRSDTYRVAIRDLYTSDIEALCIALGDEATRRVKDRWAMLQEELPF